MAKSMALGGGGRFEALSNRLGKQGATNPDALAAYIGKKKYGNKKMSRMAAVGRRLASHSNSDERVKANLSTKKK